MFSLVDDELSLEDVEKVFGFFVLHNTDLFGHPTDLLVELDGEHGARSLFVDGAVSALEVVDDESVLVPPDVLVHHDVAVSCMELALLLCSHFHLLEVLNPPDLFKHKHKKRSDEDQDTKD